MTRFAFVCDADLAPDGDDPRMYCARCDTTVHDLSAMTREDAAALLDGQSGPLCGRLRLDADLEPIFVPSATAGRRTLTRGLLLGAAGLAATLAGCVGEPPRIAVTEPASGGLRLGPVDVKSRLDLLIADAVQRAQRDARAVAAPCETATEAAGGGQPEKKRRLRRGKGTLRAGPQPSVPYTGVLAAPSRVDHAPQRSSGDRIKVLGH